jgi:non-specific serine/threonine protein kinase
LGIAGEALFIVRSLAFPDPDHLPPVDRLTDYPAISLFLDRARLVLPDYRVAAHDVAALARICQRLDGLPLALEMAASRLRMLNTTELAARLDNAFMCCQRQPVCPAQAPTLQATLDWSHDLLTEPGAGCGLSVFVGAALMG